MSTFRMVMERAQQTGLFTLSATEVLGAPESGDPSGGSFQAATAVAERGYNVDRCFIRISPGGVGQGLYFSEMSRQNHAFCDPNIWHLDEELPEAGGNICTMFQYDRS